MTLKQARKKAEIGCKPLLVLPLVHPTGVYNVFVVLSRCPKVNIAEANRCGFSEIYKINKYTQAVVSWDCVTQYGWTKDVEWIFKILNLIFKENLKDLDVK